MTPEPDAAHRLKSANPDELRVLKFGGGVLGAADTFLAAVQTVQDAATAGCVLVAVSAMGSTTRELHALGTTAAAGQLDLALEALADLERRSAATLHAALGEDCTQQVADMLREILAPAEQLVRGIHTVGELSLASRDRLLAYGELCSARLFVVALAARGVRAEWVDSRAWTCTDSQFGNAEVDLVETARKLTIVHEARTTDVVVHTGFLGLSPEGRPTTLGRNGTDYTATLLAGILGAREIVIWTDVSGVMTADPDVVSEARPVAHLSYDEALELAHVGLGILHPRTMTPLVAREVPLRVRKIGRPSEAGTLVDRAGSSDEERPACVVSLERMALLEVQSTPHDALAPMSTRVLACLAAARIPVWLEAQAARGAGSVLVVSEADAQRTRTALERELAADIAGGRTQAPTLRVPVTLLTLVAEAMGRKPNVAGRFYGALGRLGINVLASAQGASSRAISAVVAAEDTALAVRTIHSAFNLAREQVSLVLLGRGTVGMHLLEQVRQHGARLSADRGVLLRVVGVLDSRGGVFDEHGLDLDALARGGLPFQPGFDAMRAIERARSLPTPILVDCTAADTMPDVYEHAFERGLHVVAANKKPLAGPSEILRRVQQAARSSHRSWRYETTVGASLPVVETLQNLVRTGDRVRAIEGSLSGTLGYLCLETMANVTLADAVRAALARGYTEPHPAIDLLGADAARKTVILARELGLAVELEDVHVEPLIPAALLRAPDLESFFAELERYEPIFRKHLDGLKQEGKALRYLARVEVEDGRARVTVGPTAVATEHPATRLREAESYVAFYTDRYAHLPLVVQGAGAGGAVTAAGVLADILAIARGIEGS